MADYEKLKKMVECELDKISALPELTDTTLMQLDKLIDIVKDIEELEGEMMPIGGASQRTMYGYYDDGVTMDGRTSSRGGRSYGMSYNNGMSYDNGRMNRGYSMNGSLMDHLHAAMDTAQNDRERNAIQELVNKMNNM